MISSFPQTGAIGQSEQGSFCLKAKMGRSQYCLDLCPVAITSLQMGLGAFALCILFGLISVSGTRNTYKY